MAGPLELTSVDGRPTKGLNFVGTPFRNTAPSAANEGADAVRKIAGSGGWPAVCQAVKKRRGEGISRTDGIRYPYLVSGHRRPFASNQDRAPFFTPSNTHCLPAEALASAVDGVTITDLARADQCCGFGGLFAVKMPEISGAMLEEKVENIERADADVIVTGDASCLTQMNGGLSRSESSKRVVHIADLLARGLKHDGDGGE